ncbi:MAG: efflux RND transporter permease subunit [Planctomycetes bacterium]|nr:efflux RND transporter permease subunit [Planctomycetota bacterium]
MSKFIAWFTRNHVAANLVMGLLLIGGLMTLPVIRKTAFPDIEPEVISISVLYPGATAEEIEESLIIKIEEAVQGIDGVDRISSKASESLGVVTVEIKDGENIKDVTDEVKAEVDAITTFPAQAEEPVIQEGKVQERVVWLLLSGNMSERDMKALADSVRDELVSLRQISKAEVTDAREYEITIDVREADLRRYGLTFSQIAAAVRLYSVNLPAGSVETRGGEILFRSSSQAYTREEFASIPLITRADGTDVRVGDVGDVRATFEDVTLESRVNGRRSVMIEVYRVGDQDTLGVATAVGDYMESKRSELPPGVTIEKFRDISTDLNERLELLQANGIMGLLLVFLVLALFLKARLALWVGIGLTTAVLGTVWVMPYFGMTINFLTSFGFVLALGILVDDAIVVGENIDAHKRMGKPAMQAAIEGTREVMLPVGLAVATTSIAFSPMLQLPGRTGVFAGAIASIVILALALSLVESLFILPSHLSHEHRPGRFSNWFLPRAWQKFQGWFEKGVQWFIDKTYTPALEWAIRWRWTVLAIGLGFLITTAGLFAAGFVKVAFFPAIEGNDVIADVTLPEGASAEETRAALQTLEDAAEEIRHELEGDRRGSVVENIRAVIGTQPFRMAGGPPAATGVTRSRDNVAEVHIALVQAEARPMKASEIRDLWRKKVFGRIPNAVELTFSSDQINVGAPVSVELSGNDIEQIEASAEDLKEHLATYDGTFDITDDYREGKLEIAPYVRESGHALGLTQASLIQQVRGAFYGDEAQRVQIGKDEVRVFVRYPEDERRSISNLENMRVRLPNGRESAFSEVADYTITRGISSINRLDRRRTIVVTSDLNRSITNANELNAVLAETYMPQLMEKYPGLDWKFGGEQERQAESFAGLRVGLALSLFLMFGLLAVAFRSYFQPSIVMWAIPFGIAGAVWAHFALGMDLTFLSIVGLLALSGVVVNDSLVMIDFINRNRREEGHTIFDAVRAAGPRRFRPILLTSLTTFAGLTPIMLERSVQAAFLIPMAVSLAFGIAFATVIILLMVPATYLAVEDVLIIFRRWFNKDLDPHRGEGQGPEVIIAEKPDESLTLEPSS